MKSFVVRAKGLRGPSDVLNAVDELTAGLAAYLYAVGESDWAARDPWADFVIASDDATPSALKKRLGSHTQVISVSSLAQSPPMISPDVCDPVIRALVGAQAVFDAVRTITKDAGFPIADAGRGKNRGRDYVHARFQLRYDRSVREIKDVVALLRAVGLKVG